MSPNPSGGQESVTNPKHIFDNPRHHDLVARVRRSTTSQRAPSATSQSRAEEPPSPRSEKKGKGVHMPGRRHVGALASVFRPRRNTGKEPTKSSSRPNSRDKEKPQSWSDWHIDDDAAQQFRQHYEQPDPYYTSDSEEDNPDGERRSKLLPPLNRGVPQLAKHSAGSYEQLIEEGRRGVYGHEEEEEAHPKWI
ncbi:hypothetical protein AAT19DRAFT_9044 [Rhodotorula toruloides]|uniref:Uncharacterized protein n=1 Tax=Rhodotorula toruloides TaxID=5286 RepID=A0A2T0AJ02_RHOTO|nr:hypothetical protein AAT19DRAFT_9044 [Rhodotorula toruloides]